MDVFGSIFQTGYNNYMLAEALDKYVLASAEAAYEDPGKQAPLELMVSGGNFHDAGNASYLADQKHTLFPRPTF